MRYDLCVAWNWEYDADFIGLLSAACQARGLSLLQVTPGNLTDIWPSLASCESACQVTFDRASEADPRFVPYIQCANSYAAYQINRPTLARRAWDKVAMHQALSAVLDTPATIVLRPYAEQPDLSALDLTQLGPCFVVKPAHGGGGAGVVTQVTTLAQVLAARQEYPADQYLVQARVVPAQLGERPGWFRVLYCAGQVYPCWWDTSSHHYAPVMPAEERDYHLAPLRSITARIADICRLDLFSTEIALSLDATFMVIDYVNDPVDLRLQSKAAEGVPDLIVHDIAECLAERVMQSCRAGAT
jgi:hypothetical protein